MNFSLSETQQQVQELATQILSDATSPAQLAQFDKTGYFDRSLWQSLADAGLLGIAIGEEHGGMGLDFETLCVFLEAAGQHAAPVPLLSVLVDGALPLQAFSPVISASILPSIVSGEKLLTSDLHSSVSVFTAQESNENEVLLNGKSGMVALGNDADYCLLKAELNQQTIIVLADLTQSQCSRELQVLTTGEHAATLTLNHLPARLIASGTEAEALLSLATRYSQTAGAAYAVGIAESMIKQASTYTADRKQFGKAIGSFQAVQQQLANTYIDKECLRAASEKAIYELSLDDTSDSSREAALISNIWLGDALHNISHTTQHVHGGMGVDRDYGLFRYCTAARALELRYHSSSQAKSELGKIIGSGAS
jgi:alkylation response protein AidB-like acyl-CoA dehydrogenase